MADVQSKEVSTQAKDTPSSANVEEQKCPASKWQFFATDLVLRPPCNQKSCSTCLSEEEAIRIDAEQPVVTEKTKKVFAEAHQESMFALFFTAVCNIILYLFFARPEEKTYLEALKFAEKCLVHPILLYMLLRYVYIIISFVAHKIYITYKLSPTEDIDLVEKKYFEERKKCILSLLKLFAASLWLMAGFEIVLLLVSCW